MKKSSRAQVSKTAFSLAKTLNGSQDPDAEAFNLTRENTMEDSIQMQRLEEEVMGEVSESDSLKSVALQRNLDQMIDVLHLRLRALETAARARLDFCAEDLMANSSKQSKMAPKIMEEFEDLHVNPRVLMKDVKQTNQSKVYTLDINININNNIYSRI